MFSKNTPGKGWTIEKIWWQFLQSLLQKKQQILNVQFFVLRTPCRTIILNSHVALAKRVLFAIRSCNFAFSQNRDEWLWIHLHFIRNRILLERELVTFTKLHFLVGNVSNFYLYFEIFFSFSNWHCPWDGFVAWFSSLHQSITRALRAGLQLMST